MRGREAYSTRTNSLRHNSTFSELSAMPQDTEAALVLTLWRAVLIITVALGVRDEEKCPSEYYPSP